MVEYIGTTEASKILHICVATLHAYHRTGRLVPEVVTKTGRRKYTRKQLEDFIKNEMENR